MEYLKIFMFIFIEKLRDTSSDAEGMKLRDTVMAGLVQNVIYT
jgi:hypothetical protein